jgi:hypothetical protein
MRGKQTLTQGRRIRSRPMGGHAYRIPALAGLCRAVFPRPADAGGPHRQAGAERTRQRRPVRDRSRHARAWVVGRVDAPGRVEGAGGGRSTDDHQARRPAPVSPVRHHAMAPALRPEEARPSTGQLLHQGLGGAWRRACAPPDRHGAGRVAGPSSPELRQVPPLRGHNYQCAPAAGVPDVTSAAVCSRSEGIRGRFAGVMPPLRESFLDCQSERTSALLLALYSWAPVFSLLRMGEGGSETFPGPWCRPVSNLRSQDVNTAGGGYAEGAEVVHRAIEVAVHSMLSGGRPSSVCAAGCPGIAARARNRGRVDCN